MAAFDTRFKADEQKSIITRFVVKTGGYAAKRIADQLKKAGGVVIVPPEGFYVIDTEGPLKARRAGARRRLGRPAFVGRAKIRLWPD